MLCTFQEINSALFGAGFIYSHGAPFVAEGGKNFIRTYEKSGKYIKVVSPLEDNDSVKAENIRVKQVSHAKIGNKHICWVPDSIVHFSEEVRG